MNRKLLLATIAATTVATALLDMWTSADTVESILFTLPVALCALQRSRRLLWGTVAVAIVLTIVAEFYGFQSGPLQHPLAVSVNRGLVVASLLTMATFIHFWMRAEERIQRQELQLKEVFHGMTDAVVVADFEKNTVEHNRAAASLFGLANRIVSLEELAAGFEGFLPSGAPLTPEQWPLMRAAHGDYCTNTEILIRKKDTGSTITAEITAVPMATAGKRDRKVILSIRDIGERVQAEELIRRQKTELQNVFDNLNEGIMMMDMDLNIVQINRAASRLLGIPNAEVSRDVIKSIFEVMSPSGQQLLRDQWPSGLASNGEFIENREFRVRRTDTGNEIIAQISTAPVLDSSGNVMQIIFSYRDITSTREADEERRRLAAIVDFSVDAIIGKDDKGIVTSWNAGATKVFGYSAAEMIGQSITRLLPEDRLNEEADILARIKRGELVDHFETVRVRKDGQQIYVSLTISPIRDAGGNIIGASKIARDITEKRRMQHLLQQSQKMDAIGQLTGGIAHDFNNLLSIVIGNLDLLERKVNDNAAALEHVQTAKKAGLRGADLTRRLLAFSSDEALSSAPAKLHHLIGNILEMTQRVIGPEIKIATSFDKSISTILIDAAGFESALVNLMVNARDAMPKGGSITISTQYTRLGDDYPPIQAGELKAGLYSCVAVSDTGEGMSKQTLERVFEPFFTTKPRGKGTGLGLAMVYGFAKQSHGTVRIYSEPGYGTTVNLYLPAAEEALIPAVELVGAPTCSIGSFTVLVVDDELDLLEIATAYLTEMGWKSYAAVDGNNALKVIQKHDDIDLLITDIIMPGGMNGVELAEQVRRLNPRIKVIYCSGFPAGSLAERSMPLVDGPLLRKPYQRDEFGEMVRRVMETGNAKTML